MGLNNRPARRSGPVLALLVGASFLAVGGFMLAGRLGDLVFALGQLPRWQEARAVVYQADVVSSDLGSRSTKTRTSTYKVVFDLELGFETAQGRVTERHLAEVAGSTAQRAVPAEALERFKADTLETVSYNPDSPADLRIGSKSQIRSEAVAPGRWVLPLLGSLAGAGLIALWARQQFGRPGRRRPVDRR
ncbi:MAG: DUF3592 domain-containing protein [Bifidobacteriaceae bacterium]|nr:DUF3592 domain-containing protein [Bifidobacteriaceae bacterium]